MSDSAFHSAQRTRLHVVAAAWLQRCRVVELMGVTVQIDAAEAPIGAQMQRQLEDLCEQLTHAEQAETAFLLRVAMAALVYESKLVVGRSTAADGGDAVTPVGASPDTAPTDAVEEAESEADKMTRLTAGRSLGLHLLAALAAMPDETTATPKQTEQVLEMVSRLHRRHQLFVNRLTVFERYWLARAMGSSSEWDGAESGGTGLVGLIRQGSGLLGMSTSHLRNIRASVCHPVSNWSAGR